MSYIILSGGFIIWPIILLSIISLAIVIEKSWNLARDAVLPKDLTKDVISQIEKKSLTNSMNCLLYTSPSPRDRQKSRMPSCA